MAQRATAALAAGDRLLLTDLVLAECVYVLELFYGVERARVAELMRATIALRTIDALDPGSLLRALEVYELNRLEFAEAHLVAQAEATGVDEISRSTAASTASTASHDANRDHVSPVCPRAVLLVQGDSAGGVAQVRRELDEPGHPVR